MSKLREKIEKLILANIAISITIGFIILAAIMIWIFSGIIDTSAINEVLEKPLAETKFWHFLLAAIFFVIAFRKEKD